MSEDNGDTKKDAQASIMSSEEYFENMEENPEDFPDVTDEALEDVSSNPEDDEWEDPFGEASLSTGLAEATESGTPTTEPLDDNDHPAGSAVAKTVAQRQRAKTPTAAVPTINTTDDKEEVLTDEQQEEQEEIVENEEVTEGEDSQEEVTTGESTTMEVESDDIMEAEAASQEATPPPTPTPETSEEREGADPQTQEAADANEEEEGGKKETKTVSSKIAIMAILLALAAILGVSIYGLMGDDDDEGTSSTEVAESTDDNEEEVADASDQEPAEMHFAETEDESNDESEEQRSSPDNSSETDAENGEEDSEESTPPDNRNPEDCRLALNEDGYPLVSPSSNSELKRHEDGRPVPLSTSEICQKAENGEITFLWRCDGDTDTLLVSNQQRCSDEHRVMANNLQPYDGG